MTHIQMNIKINGGKFLYCGRALEAEDNVATKADYRANPKSNYHHECLNGIAESDGVANGSITKVAFI